MANNSGLTVGPVLSFRGTKTTDKKTLWHVTALIGIPIGSTAPDMTVEGNPCPAPVLLHETNNTRLLRYDLTVSLSIRERTVEYGLANSDLRWRFTVPAADIMPRITYVSCNGFSDPAGMRKLVRPATAVWADLLCNHDRNLRPADYRLDKEQLWHEERSHNKGLQRFHVLLMGGDQIYFDSLWEDIPELKQWVGLSREEQLAFKVPAALKQRIERYYFNLYTERWLPPKRSGWSGKSFPLDSTTAMATMPTVMMWDDHDIFDGWGSYSPKMQQCDLFKTLFHYARQAFWVYQMQHALADLPLLENAYGSTVSQIDPQLKPVSWSQHMASDPLALPLLDNQPGFSYGHQLGPVALFVADLRTERSRTQILSEPSWQAMQAWMQNIPGATTNTAQATRCQHFLFMSSVPVAHPKLTLIENALDIFGQDHVLDSNADDLNDHWSHDTHEGERKRLIKTLTLTAKEKQLRAHIISGDVHVGAWGIIQCKDVPPASSWAEIQQFTSSAVVHPSLSNVFERLFLSILNNAAEKPQSIDVAHTIQMMLFPNHNQYIMPARNWLSLELDGTAAQGAKLWATWRCENKEGFSNHLQAVQPVMLEK